MKPQAFYAEMVEMGISLGFAKAGTAVTALEQQLTGGTMTKKTAINMTEAGMLLPSDWTSGGSGGVHITPAGTRRFAAVNDDPIAWLTGQGEAYITKYAADNGISKIAAIYALYGRQTTQRFVAEAITAGPQFARALAGYGGVPDMPAQYKMLGNESYDTNMLALTTAWKGLMEAMAQTDGPIKLLQALTSAIHALTDAAVAHPDAAADLFYLASALAALAVVGGSLVVLSIGLRALLAPLTMLTEMTGLTALGTSFGGLAASLVPFAVGGAAFLAIGALMGRLHDLMQFGNPSGFGPMTGGPGQGAAPVHLPPNDVRPPGIAPMPGDDDYRILPPAAAPAPQRLGSVILNLDGRQFASLILDHAADHLNRPPTGPNGPDIRVGGLQPGVAGNWALA